jgi:hypothetical protein
MRAALAKPSIRDAVANAHILAYREDTSRLENAMLAEGIRADVIRPVYSETELTYSRTIRCLLNHCNAWRKAAAASGLTLIMEADFVPCRGFGSLPLPYQPVLYQGRAWAFLYAGGPRFIKMHPDGSIQGHTACPVAYVVSPVVAKHLIAFAENETGPGKDLTQYSLWDTNFQWHIMGHNIACFMPYRQYGEHGGIGNIEHKNAGVGVAKRLAASLPARLRAWQPAQVPAHSD